MQSCGATQAAAPCDRLQKAVYKAPPADQQSVLPIDRATVVYTAKQQAARADQLAKMPISDPELSARRSNLTALYRDDSGLGLQAASLMDAGGEVEAAGVNRAAYEQVANQRIALTQQIKEQLDAIDRYCGR